CDSTPGGPSASVTRSMRGPSAKRNASTARSMSPVTRSLLLGLMTTMRRGAAPWPCTAPPAPRPSSPTPPRSSSTLPSRRLRRDEPPVARLPDDGSVFEHGLAPDHRQVHPPLQLHAVVRRPLGH